jgi:hypothetical protein
MDGPVHEKAIKPINDLKAGSVYQISGQNSIPDITIATLH